MASGSGFAGFGAALSAWVDKKINGVDNAVARVAQETAQEGSEIVKEFIETRGTAKSGKRGRVETGDMRDSVSGQSRKVSRGVHQAEFGWIQGTPEYSRFQERGFNHIGGGAVGGMFALTDAGELEVQLAKKRLEEEIRGL